MPRKLPRLCVHKASQRYYVKIAGVRHYLGAVGEPTDEARADAERLRLLAEHQGRPAPAKNGDATVNELLAGYMPEARAYYRHKDGEPTQEIVNIAKALQPLQRLYGPTSANTFTPVQLEALRETMMSGDWMDKDSLAFLAKSGREPGRSRKTINKDVDRIRRAFRFGVKRGMVRPEVYHQLMAVDHLKQYRSQARETEEVGPAPEKSLQAAFSHVTPHVADMLRLQLLTGARPGEICRLCPGDIDRTGAALAALIGERIDLGRVWVYIPGRHKTAHHGHKRYIPIGPRAQQLLAPYLEGRAPDQFCFSPAESREQFDAARRAARKTPPKPSQTARRRKRKPKKTPGPKYTADAYAAAVRKACKRAKVPGFHPHQLRHNAAALLVEQFGWEVARIVLGHRTLNATRIYAPDNLQKGFKAIEAIG